MDKKQLQRAYELELKAGEQNTEIVKWARWRWEFMRHNSRVKDAWGDVQKLRARAQYPPGTIRREGNLVEDLYASTPEYQEEIDLKRKLNIPSFFGYFPDPAKCFEEITCGKMEEFAVRAKEPHGGVSVAFDLTSNSTHSSKIIIKIDIDKINSIEDLKTYLCHEIDRYSNMVGRRPRKNKTDYDRIIEIGELKRQGLTGCQIAEIIFPNDFDLTYKNNNPANAERKVYKMIQKYNDLVNGGYLYLSFP
jgi:hypothetical protein